MKAHPMKAFPSLLVMLCFCALATHATPLIGSPSSSSVTAGEPVNYIISVTWKNANKGTNTLQLVTGEGSFELDTISGTTKMDQREIPNTVKLSGSLTSLAPDKGRMQLFIGRTVPYVTSTYGGVVGNNSSSYSQLSVGLQSTFVVTYGHPLVIQTDDNGQVVLLVKRDAK